MQLDLLTSLKEAYMWLMLESMFLASCGMFEIVFSLPVGLCLWVLPGAKIYWYQLLASRHLEHPRT